MPLVESGHRKILPLVESGHRRGRGRERETGAEEFQTLIQFLFDPLLLCSFPFVVIYQPAHLRPMAHDVQAHLTHGAGCDT
jgi:hypothetical protein